MRFRYYKIRATVVACLFVGTVFALPVFAADRVPNDTYFSEQWYLKHIGVPEAWNNTLGLETVSIAIIDSGVDLDHPDLKDNIWTNTREIPGNGIDDDNNGYIDDVHGWDFIGNDNDPRPDITKDFSVVGANHGTINAGVTAAKGDNGKGIVGVTWQSTIMSLRALDSNGEGDPSRVVQAVEYAVRNGAKVINLSFAGTAASPELAASLRRAYDAGVFIVAAAGNAPDDGVAVNLDERSLYPICLDRGSDENFIFGVAATDDKDVKADFSNFGASCIDASAPGTRILSTQLWRPGKKYFDSPYGGFYSGTSVAAPIVSGVVALLFALDHNLTPKQITNILTSSSVNIDRGNTEYFGKIGRGRIDAKKADGVVLGMLHGGVPPTPTAALVPPGSSGRYVIAASGPGRATEVRLFTDEGVFIRGFQPFASGFRGGASLALADFDGTGKRTIVVGALAGGAPQVRVFDSNTRNIGGWFAYDSAFRGGVDIATADLDGDGKEEIVTGAGPSGGPHVRVFTANGVLKAGFFAFDEKRRTGVNVAAGDLDGDGRAEIVASPPDGSAVRIFDAKGRLITEFFPFGKGNKSQARVSVEDLNGDGKIEIVVRRALDVRRELVFRLQGVDVVASNLLAATTIAARAIGVMAGRAPEVTTNVPGGMAFSFLAFDAKFRGGVRAAVTQ